jgi:hypothetical protein
VLALLADLARRSELGAATRAFAEAKWTCEAPFLSLETALRVACSAAPVAAPSVAAALKRAG